VNQRFQLIQGKRTGELDQDAMSPSELPTFEEALVAHLDSLFAFALRVVNGQRGQAEDLVQDVCLRAFRGYGSLRSAEKVKPWLFQILINTHINEFHRRSRDLHIIDVELSDALLESADLVPSASPEERIFEQLLDGEVQQALDALPAEFRVVVWLSDVEELSYKEIAEITGCPLGTVASRLYRGHSLLREHLREYARQRGLKME